MWGRGRHTVLIVSDPQPAPGLRPGFLRQPSIRLLLSSHNHEALETVQRVGPDLVIQDLAPPEQGERDLHAPLRIETRDRSIPLILVTENEPDRSAALAAPLSPPDAVVRKPIVQREYYEAVARFIPLPERRVLRHAVNLRFSFCSDEISGQAFTRDLSLHGAFLKTDRAPEPGTRMKIRFGIPGDVEPIGCGAIVRRTAPYTLDAPQLAGFAVEFEGISEEDLHRLEKFIERHLKKPLFAF